MFSVAIVEDDKLAADLLAGYIDAYAASSKEEFSVTVYANAIDFLSNYKAGYDIVFMDIDMPHLDGLSASRKLRQLDTSTVLIFVTNMAQYAIKGYEVQAMDYMLKPIKYYDFLLKLQRAVNFTRASDNQSVAIVKGGGYVRVYVRDISYIEVMGHKVLYHVGKEEVEEYSALAKVEEKMKPFGFLRPNNYCLVNPKHITLVHGMSVNVGGTELPISHPKKKAFMHALGEWLARGQMQ